ncbi:hypothetical protein SynBIOSU31_01811 [Synechococcus sp. BIOS-U3-1]|nr:hypothetical protein SynBIOSU31_01811 [Synechococcus sp. BIOS-U3-1]
MSGLIPQLRALFTFFNAMQRSFIQWLKLWLFKRIQNFY